MTFLFQLYSTSVLNNDMWSRCFMTSTIRGVEPPTWETFQAGSTSRAQNVRRYADESVVFVSALCWRFLTFQQVLNWVLHHQPSVPDCGQVWDLLWSSSPQETSLGFVLGEHQAGTERFLTSSSLNKYYIEPNKKQRSVLIFGLGFGLCVPAGDHLGFCTVLLYLCHGFLSLSGP